jgi:hypothetical protein
MLSILKQKMTYVYLSLSIVSVAVALIIGIDDNPPGILLCFIGSILFILAFTYSWKRAKTFILLAVFSLLGLVISAILHNVFEAVGGEGTFPGAIGVVFFLIAIFICPAGLLVGIVGSIVKSLRKVNTVKT